MMVMEFTASTASYLVPLAVLAGLLLQHRYRTTATKTQTYD